MKNELNNNISIQKNSFISNYYNNKITKGIINILKILLEKNKN